MHPRQSGHLSPSGHLAQSGQFSSFAIRKVFNFLWRIRFRFIRFWGRIFSLYFKFYKGFWVAGWVTSTATAVGLKAGGKPRVSQGACQRDCRRQRQRQGDAGRVQGVHGGAEDFDLWSVWSGGKVAESCCLWSVVAVHSESLCICCKFVLYFFFIGYLLLCLFVGNLPSHSNQANSRCTSLVVCHFDCKLCCWKTGGQVDSSPEQRRSRGDEPLSAGQRPDLDGKANCHSHLRRCPCCYCLQIQGLQQDQQPPAGGDKEAEFGIEEEHGEFPGGRKVEDEQPGLGGLWYKKFNHPILSIQPSQPVACWGHGFCRGWRGLWWRRGWRQPQCLWSKWCII